MKTAENASAWTDERVEVVKAMWPDGKSATQIRVVLNRDHGASFSRNAIIGKIHRLGLGGRVTAAKLKGAPKAKRERPVNLGGALAKSRKPDKPMPTLRVAEVKPDPVPFTKRESYECSVLLDGYEEPTCCGAWAVKRGMCAGHAAIMLSDAPLRPLNESYLAGLGNRAPARRDPPRMSTFQEAA